MTLSKLRRQSRELSLQILFQQTFSPEMTLTQSLQYFHQSFPFDEEIWDYAKILAYGVSQHNDQLHQLTDQHASHWSVDRIALVDLILIKICLFEVLYNKIPKRIAINEALEISRKYSSSESSRFINGVLDQALKSKEDGE